MGKFRETILHIGPHKTGSSAIQKACDTNREKLQAHSIYYPLGRWHAQFGSCFCSKPEEYGFNILSGRWEHDRIRKEDSSYLDGLTKDLNNSCADKLLLSYEGFIGLSEDALRAMQNYLASFGESITIMFYCREPLSFACSEISQRLKAGVPHVMDMKLNPPVLSYRDFSEKFRKVFGVESVHPRVYARESMPRGDVVLDFFDAIGLDENAVSDFTFQENDENPALSHEASLLADAIRKRGDFSLFGNEFSNRYSAILEKIKGKKFRLTGEQAKQVMAAAEPDLDYLENTYGIRLFPDKRHIDSNESPILLSDVTLDSLAEVIAELCSGKSSGRLVTKMPVSNMIPGEQESIAVTIENRSQWAWVGNDLYPVNLSYHWLKASGEMLVFEGIRSPLPAVGVAPGQTLDAEMWVKAPQEEGTYILVLTLLQERVGWFENKGFEAARLTVEVVSKKLQLNQNIN